MGFIPKLKNYDIDVLVVLGNQTDDIFNHNYIKFLIVEKILEFNYSMFMLYNKFISSEGILKEAYAEIMVMELRDYEYHIDDSVVDEIIKMASLDILLRYGMESCSLDFCEKCKNEFWKRAIEIEDKAELNRKANLEKKIRSKRKGE